MGMIQSLVSMPGAVFTGWIFDQTQSYTYAVIPFTVMYALAGLMLWRARRPRRPREREVSAAQAIDIQPLQP
jgi:uncharacterized membrane protein YfcA